MKKTVVFFLTVLLFLSPVFPGPGGNKGTETFLSADKSPIYLSFENNRKKDGWTPVILSLGELNFLLWMDPAGRAAELRDTGCPFVEPVCFIDKSTQCLRMGANALYFEIYEKNRVRTRWRLSSGVTGGTVTKKILLKEGEIDLSLGTLRLKLNHVAWDFQELFPGLFQVKFHGVPVAAYQDLVYEKASGIIYSTHGRKNRLLAGPGRTWSLNPNRSTSGDSIPPQERAALIALYNNTAGDNWNNKSGWKTPPLAGDGFALPGTENTWYGITCDPGNTTVQSIQLDSNNLDGILPPELENLDNLKELYLGWNQVRGPIPPELGNLANLQCIWLYSNQLSGSIPPELGNLANLEVLELGQNQLNGAIPPELGNLTNLQYITLSWNQLNGSIPPELANPVNLQHMGLYQNQLSGTIPPELGNLANLQYLNLDGNQLNGAIPPDLATLSNLTVLSLNSNQLNGTLPPVLGNLEKLEYLHLYENQLSGSLPPELGNLSRLKSLGLGLNWFSGTIPSELGNLSNLQILHLHVNQFSGSMPPALTILTNLAGLDLGYNRFSGTIPPGLGNLLNLRWLSLNSNQFRGSIPANFTNLNKLFNGGSNFQWNALYTNDDILSAFLDAKQAGGNWEGTQTIAPAEVTAAAVSTSSIAIDWTPIPYTSDSGGYRIFYSTTPGGPYTYFSMTANKTASSLTVTGLNPGTTYYFVVQTRTNPHGNNQNTVNSEYSSEVSAVLPPLLILTSPNGGESWWLGTVHNITWTSAGVSGNIQLELWKADKRVSIIAAHIPIANGNYPWLIGQYSPGTVPTGNDYRVKILAANGLYNDISNGYFSIVNQAIKLTSPLGGERWDLGTQKKITWTSVGLTGKVNLLLLQGGVTVGTIAQGIPITNEAYTWIVGKHSNGMAPAGNYNVKIVTESNGYYDVSGSIRIW